MAKNKTTETEYSVEEYLNKITNENRRKDGAAIIELTQQLTGLTPKMWGTGIVGFGRYHYKYASGHEGDAPLTGFAARANAIVLYFSLNELQREELLPKFGKHKIGKACIYIKKLRDIDLDVLSKMITSSIANIKNTYPS